MRKRMILTALAAVAIPTLLMAADEARLMRFPATNGSEIVFSYAGDLYKVPATGGEAQRLTSYVGYEMFPRFSPDGMLERALTGAGLSCTTFESGNEVLDALTILNCINRF